MQRINRNMLDLTGYINVWREQVFTATAGQTDFKLSTGITYPVNRNMINVFLNGDLQRKGLDYTEFDNTTIKTTEGLRAGDVLHLRFQVPYSEVLTSWPEIKIEEAKKVANVMRQQTFTVTEGQTVFSLNEQYSPGTYTLSVFLNGIKQRIGIDYLETDNGKVTFTSGLKGTDRLEMNWLAPTGQFLLGTVNIADAADESVPMKKIAGLVKRLDDQKYYINVKEYGAIGDGITDDTRALQVAIDDAFLKDAVIFLPLGVYKVSDTLFLPKSLKIQGANSGYRGKGYATYSSCRIKFTKKDGTLFKRNPLDTNTELYLQMRDLCLNYNDLYYASSTNLPSAVTFENIKLVDHSSIENCLIQAFNTVFLNSTIGSASRIFNNTFREIGKAFQSGGVVGDAFISLNYFNGSVWAENGADCFSEVTSFNMTIINSNWFEFFKTVIQSKAGALMNSVSITNNIIDYSYNGIEGLELYCVVSGNIFNHCSKSSALSSFKNLKPDSPLLTQEWVNITAKTIRGTSIIGNLGKESEQLISVTSDSCKDLFTAGNNVSKENNSTATEPSKIVRYSVPATGWMGSAHNTNVNLTENPIGSVNYFYETLTTYSSPLTFQLHLEVFNMGFWKSKQMQVTRLQLTKSTEFSVLTTHTLLFKT